MKRSLLVLWAFLFATSFLFAGGRRESDAVPIGAIFPLSGPVAFYGNESRDGALVGGASLKAESFCPIAKFS